MDWSTIFWYGVIYVSSVYLVMLVVEFVRHLLKSIIKGCYGDEEEETVALSGWNHVEPMTQEEFEARYPDLDEEEGLPFSFGGQSIYLTPSGEIMEVVETDADAKKLLAYPDKIMRDASVGLYDIARAEGKTVNEALKEALEAYLGLDSKGGDPDM